MASHVTGMTGMCYHAQLYWLGWILTFFFGLAGLTRTMILLILLPKWLGLHYGPPLPAQNFY
jgi:hypothetical protein